jgi:hypothetical protein
MPNTGSNPPQPGSCCGGSGQGAAGGECRGETEAQAVPLNVQKKEGGIRPGQSNTPGGALNTGPDAGGRGMGEPG